MLASDSIIEKFEEIIQNMEFARQKERNMHLS
jgi:hypothetical protein